MNLKLTVPRKRRRRAIVLVLTLWIAIILTIMAASVARELRLNLKLAGYHERQLHARGLARAGLAKAVVDLRNDRLLAIADPQALLTDSHKDVWAQGDDKTDIELGEGSFTVRIEDEESKFDITHMNRQNVLVLGYILREVGEMDRQAANVLAHMLLDWQDSDMLLSTGSGTGEVEFYTEWVHDELPGSVPADWVYAPKNDVFLTFDELLAVPGITRELLYGTAESRAEFTSEQRFEAREQSRALADYITLGGTGIININTVPSIVLGGIIATALPDFGDPEGLAGKLHEYRTSLERSEGTSGTIQNFAQLQETGLGAVQLSRMNAVTPLRVGSTYFTLTSTGRYEGVEKTLQVKVQVGVESFGIREDAPESAGRRDPAAGGSLSTIQNVRIDLVVRVVEIREY